MFEKKLIQEVREMNCKNIVLMTSELSHSTIRITQGLIAVTGILFSTLVKDFPEAYEAVQKYDADIKELLLSLGKIVREVSIYQKSTLENELGIVDVTNVIESVLSILSTEISDLGISIEKIFEAVPNALGNETLLKLVFLNVIHNALEAVSDEKNGNIRLEISEAQIPKMIEVKITDNGCGVPDEIAGQIFEPNFTTKDMGTGLGLATTRLIIELHNGSIEFESEVGKNTSFVIYLPKASDEEE